MPIKHSIWTVNDSPSSLNQTTLVSEQLLEDMVVRQPGILSEDWLLIGRQVHTNHGGYIDLLAIDSQGSLIVIELKRDKTPREVVAQTLDYASWVKDLTSERIAEIFDASALRLGLEGQSLDTLYQQKFSSILDEDTLNDSHQMVVVASTLDASTERIVGYLNKLDVPINVLFFEVFQHGETQLLSRTWLLDPIEVPVAITKGSEKAPWNGIYYACFGDDENRNWDDALEFNFISAGGGERYSKPLFNLSIGSKAWVNIPSKGYVGLAEITGDPIKALEYEHYPTLKNRQAAYHEQHENDDTLCEYFVPVKWLHSVSLKQAFRETGFFGNQNIVAQPRTQKWLRTCEKLEKHFHPKPISKS